MVLVIDLRCLQDRNYTERGIGNHTRNLLRHAPGRFVGLVDPALPPLLPDDAALAPEVSPHGYVHGASAFLNPSPFSPDQGFCARLLSDPRVVKAVCVHDFIPYDKPGQYLWHHLERLDYFASMAWLRAYDVYLPNSVPTEARLRELYGAVRSVVTGVALAPFVMGITPEAPRHILMVGGDDKRKNPEVLVKAHALSPVLGKWPLVITGMAAPPGRVSNGALRALYAQAALVVTPSRAEGFSLPVLEGIAAGAPSIASDIPAHRALLDEAYLFAPEDAAALARVAEEVLRRRDAVVAAQAGVWAPYTAEKVAARVFGALPCAPAVLRRAKPRVAVLSPMPPEKSGIAACTGALLPELRKLARVEVFSGPAISMLSLADGRYDATLSVVGNSPVHARTYEALLRFGGAVLCHDARLPGLLGPRAAAVASAELGRAVSAAEVRDWERDETRREACFLGELAAAARPLILHGRETVEVVLARFGVEARHLPFAIQRRPVLVPKAQARAALGLDPAQKLLVSFGFLSRGKAIPAALAGFARLRARLPCQLVFVGQADTDFSAAAAGVPDVLLGTGFVTEAEYDLWLSAADATLQLREGVGGNISLALQDAIVAGLPAVASPGLISALGAQGCAIPAGEDIAAALEQALNHPPEMAAAREAYLAAHGQDVYARSLLEMLLS
jgi:glycosyltransferase involved in cell wall biosynthesis